MPVGAVSQHRQGGWMALQQGQAAKRPFVMGRGWEGIGKGGKGLELGKKRGGVGPARVWGWWWFPLPDSEPPYQAEQPDMGLLMSLLTK